MTLKLTITGSTGSVGQSALGVVEGANIAGEEPAFKIEALTANTNVSRLARQAITSKARLAVIGDESLYEDLKTALAGSNVEAAAGDKAIIEACERPVDRVLAAIVGIAGLRSTHAALVAGNSVALANKESMVCAGQLLKDAAASSGASIVPTDSEHNAMFQVMERRSDIESLILTASGGPFLDTDLSTLKTVTPEQACAHPQWQMGRKISVDSATFMNKALELIEAAFLFDMPEEQIEVVVHPQSIIHSLVSYVDGSVLAQLGSPDMQTPIAHALSWPGPRVRTNVRRLNLIEIGQLDFRAVDHDRFPAIKLARRAVRDGVTAPVVMNAANEVAVDAFLSGRCRFTDINRIVENALQQGFSVQTNSSGRLDIDDIIALDEMSRTKCGELIGRGLSQLQGGTS